MSVSVRVRRRTEPRHGENEIKQPGHNSEVTAQKAAQTLCQWEVLYMRVSTWRGGRGGGPYEHSCTLLLSSVLHQSDRSRE